MRQEIQDGTVSQGWGLGWFASDREHRREELAAGFGWNCTCRCCSELRLQLAKVPRSSVAGRLYTQHLRENGVG